MELRGPEVLGGEAVKDGTEAQSLEPLGACTEHLVIGTTLTDRP